MDHFTGHIQYWAQLPKCSNEHGRKYITWEHRQGVKGQLQCNTLGPAQWCSGNDVWVPIVEWVIGNVNNSRAASKGYWMQGGTLCTYWYKADISVLGLLAYFTLHWSWNTRNWVQNVDGQMIWRWWQYQQRNQGTGRVSRRPQGRPTHHTGTGPARRGTARQEQMKMDDNHKAKQNRTSNKPGLISYRASGLVKMNVTLAITEW